MAKITFKALMEGQFAVQAWDFFSNSKRAEWVPAREARDLPKIHFSWYDREYFSTTNAKEVTALVARFGAGRDAVDVDKNGMAALWAVRVDPDGEPVQRHWTVCNFRRYGWDGTPSPKGEHGYGSGGSCWANNGHGGITCQDPEQVIRDSLVRFMAASAASGRCDEELVYSPQTRPLWDRLLQDALDPANRWNGGSGQEYAMYPIVSDRTRDLSNKKIYTIEVIG